MQLACGKGESHTEILLVEMIRQQNARHSVDVFVRGRLCTNVADVGGDGGIASVLVVRFLRRGFGCEEGLSAVGSTAIDIDPVTLLNQLSTPTFSA